MEGSAVFGVQPFVLFFVQPRLNDYEFPLAAILVLRGLRLGIQPASLGCRTMLPHTLQPEIRTGLDRIVGSRISKSAKVF